jgi:hypothetical protein
MNSMAQITIGNLYGATMLSLEFKLTEGLHQISQKRISRYRRIRMYLILSDDPSAFE